MTIQPHQLPDLSGFRSKAARSIGRLAEEHEAKTREARTTGRALEEAQGGLEAAIHEDIKARALAARRGEKDPGKRHEEEVRERITKLQDLHRVQEQVISDVEGDLMSEIQHAKPQLVAEARKLRDEAGERYSKAALSCKAAHDEQRRLAGITRWTLGGIYAPASPDVHVQSMPSSLPSEDPEQAPEVVSTESASSVLRSA